MYIVISIFTFSRFKLLVAPLLAATAANHIDAHNSNQHEQVPHRLHRVGWRDRRLDLRGLGLRGFCFCAFHDGESVVVVILEASIISHRQQAAKAAVDLQLVTATFVLGLGLQLKLAALDNLHSGLRLVARHLGNVLDLVDDVVALKDLAEDDVPAIEPGCDGGGNEELGAVGVLAGVGHAWRLVSSRRSFDERLIRLHTEETLASVADLEVLILELVAVDRLSAGTYTHLVSCNLNCSQVHKPSPLVKSPP